MAATLPTQGGDDGTWGTELNTWLVVEHDTDGTHDSAVFLSTLFGQLVYTDGNVAIAGDNIDQSIIVDTANKTGPGVSGTTLIYVT